MNSTSLRQIIRESIQEYVREIDEAGNKAALEAKMAKCQEAIELREKKIQAAESLEEVKDMVDPSKIKALKTDIKALEKALNKYKKQLDKMNNKVEKSEEVEEKEVIDEAPEMEVRMDEAGPQLEEAKKKKAPTKKEKEEKEMMNESFLYMQKLAGVITEAEYKQKKKALVKEANIIDKTKSALGVELKTPKTFNTEEINNKQLTPDQKDVKNKIIMALNDYNKDVKDSYYLMRLNAEKLIDKGLVISTVDDSAKEFEEELKKKGLNVSSTKKSSTSYRDAGDYQPSPITVTRVTMTVTK
jgi:hypothetical protein